MESYQPIAFVGLTRQVSQREQNASDVASRQCKAGDANGWIGINDIVGRHDLPSVGKASNKHHAHQCTN